MFLVLENEPVHNRVKVAGYIHKKMKNNSFTPQLAQHYTFVTGTSDHIPLPDQSQKLVLCRKVIHEFKDLSKMAAEMARIMPKGGTLIVVEADPILSGPVDPRCDKPYLSRTSIDSLFKLHSLQLVSSDTIDYDGTEVLNILKFAKYDLKFPNHFIISLG